MILYNNFGGTRLLNENRQIESKRPTRLILRTIKSYHTWLLLTTPQLAQSDRGRVALRYAS